MNNLHIMKDALGGELTMLALYAYNTSTNGFCRTVICRVKNIGDKRITVTIENVYESLYGNDWRMVPTSGQAKVQSNRLFKIEEKDILFNK